MHCTAAGIVPSSEPWKVGNPWLCKTFAESVLQPFAVQLSADENQLIVAFLAGAPGPIRPAVEQHVDALEYEAARIVLDAQDALHAKDVGPFVHQQIAQPLVELRLIEIARDGDADR